MTGGYGSRQELIVCRNNMQTESAEQNLGQGVLSKMEEEKIHTETADIDKKDDKEYHDVFWYAVQSIKENALQTTYKPPADAPDGCTGGCASCGFKCAHAAMVGKSEYDRPTTNDPYGERNRVDISEAPEPETTFPMLQILAALTACIAGCFLASKFFEHIL